MLLRCTWLTVCLAERGFRACTAVPVLAARCASHLSFDTLAVQVHWRLVAPVLVQFDFDLLPLVLAIEPHVDVERRRKAEEAGHGGAVADGTERVVRLSRVASCRTADAMTTTRARVTGGGDAAQSATEASLLPGK